MMPQNLSVPHWALVWIACALYPPARSSQSHLWLNDTLWTILTDLSASERRWHKTKTPSDLMNFWSILHIYSFSRSVTAAKKDFYNDEIHSATDSHKLFFDFKSLLLTSPPPPATNLTADKFASFFTDKSSSHQQSIHWTESKHKSWQRQRT